MTDPPNPRESGSAGSAFGDFLVEQFGPNCRPGFSAPVARVGVFLCFVNRSGSNYLAECLASSGDFPRAREFFLRANLLRYRSPGPGLSRVFEGIVSDHTRDGIFAAKLGCAQLVAFDSLGFLEAAFGRAKFLFLERRDTLAQAISLEIASQNRRWKRVGGDTVSASRELAYSRKRIELKRNGIRRKYLRFAEFFAERDVPVHSVLYEDLVSRPAEIVSGVGEFLGHPLQFESESVNLEKDRDPVKEAWKRRFLEGE